MRQIDVRGKVTLEDDKTYTISLYIFDDGVPFVEPFIEKGFLEKDIALKHLQQYGDKITEKIRASLGKAGYTDFEETRLV